MGRPGGNKGLRGDGSPEIRLIFHFFFTISAGKPIFAIPKEEVEMGNWEVRQILKRFLYLPPTSALALQTSMVR
jgi:hypothetical protein